MVFYFGVMAVYMPTPFDWIFMSFGDLHTYSNILQLVTWKTFWVQLMDNAKLLKMYIDDLTLA